MLHFISEWGAIVVGILAAAFIVIGARAALSSTADTTKSNMVNRVFAFGTGAFFTAVCLDFLPDAWSGTGEAPYWIFAGSFVMWAATHLSDGLFDRNQNQHLAASAADISEDARSKNIEQFQPIDNALDGALRFTPVSAIVLAAALSFHTFLEGAAVSLAFQDLNFKTIGFALAMIFHKLPEGVLWGLALAAVFPANQTKIKRLLTIPAVCTVAGVVLGIILVSQASSQAVNVATGVVAGAMLYIAFAELLPSLRDTVRPGLTRRWFIIGLFVMFLLNTLSNLFGG